MNNKIASMNPFPRLDQAAQSDEVVDFIANRTQNNYVNLHGRYDQYVIDCVHAFMCNNDIWGESDDVRYTQRQNSFRPAQYHDISCVMHFYDKARRAFEAMEAQKDAYEQERRQQAREQQAREQQAHTQVQARSQRPIEPVQQVQHSTYNQDIDHGPQPIPTYDRTQSSHDTIDPAYFDPRQRAQVQPQGHASADSPQQQQSQPPPMIVVKRLINSNNPVRPANKLEQAIQAKRPQFEELIDEDSNSDDHEDLLIAKPKLKLKHKSKPKPKPKSKSSKARHAQPEESSTLNTDELEEAMNNEIDESVIDISEAESESSETESFDQSDSESASASETEEDEHISISANDSDSSADSESVEIELVKKGKAAVSKPVAAPKKPIAKPVPKKPVAKKPVKEPSESEEESDEEDDTEDDIEETESEEDVTETESEEESESPVPPRKNPRARSVPVKPTPKPAPKPTPKPAAKVNPKPAPKPAAKPTPKAKPVVKPAPKPVAKPAPKLTPKPEAKPVPKGKATPKTSVTKASATKKPTGSKTGKK